MEVRVAVLADAANIAAGDKLNITGIFDTLRLREIPGRYPLMCLALRFKLDHEDAGKVHDLKIVIHDADGLQVAEAHSRVTVNAMAAGGFGHANQVIMLQDVRVNKEGVYSLRIHWNEVEKTSVDLRVIKLN